jgi:excisionase family DNA binding protein
MINQRNWGRAQRAHTTSKAAPSWPSALDFTRHQNDWAAASSRMVHQANDNNANRQLENFYSLLEVEAHWGISASTLYREIERGKLKAVKIGGQWRVSESTLIAYTKAREKPLRLPGHPKPRRKA